MNTQKIKNDIPWLEQKIHGKQVVYFDNAATTHKPQAVIDALVVYYQKHNASIARGIYSFAESATTLYEQARKTVAEFIGAADTSEIVFTRGTTESINLVASTWGKKNITAGDEIVITQLEHHANLLPWQQLCNQTGAVLKYIPITHDGALQLELLPHIITKKTKLVAITHSSNALGVQNDIAAVIRVAHTVGARVLVDAAQTAPRMFLDVAKMGADFVAFSAHKMLGPTGIGVLYIKKELHENFPPYQVGGGMVQSVDFAAASWLPVPHRLEAGTPVSAQAYAFAAALEYLAKNVDFKKLAQHEAALTTALIDGLQLIDGVRILGPIEQLKKTGHLVSFTVDGIHAHDVAAYLGSHGICVRAGHHCAQPLAQQLGITASVRVSFYCYNTLQEVKVLLTVLKTVRSVF